MEGFAFYHVDEVKIKIERLLNPSDHSLSSQTREILKLIYKQVESFEEIAKTTLHTSLDELIDSECRELEEIVDEIASKSVRYEDDGDDEEDEDEDDGGDEEDVDDGDDDDDEDVGDDDDEDVGDGDEEDEDVDDGEDEDEGEMENLKKRIHSFTPRLKIEMERCADGLYNLIPGEEEEEEIGEGEAVPVSSKMIGVSEVYQELIDKLMKQNVAALVGMPGIGKTTLAYKIFHDPTIVKLFHRVWIRVGKNCRVKDIPRRILEEMDPDALQTLPEGDEEAAVHDYLKERLKSMRYFIVLDDVWDRFALYLLHPHYRYGWKALNHPFLHLESASRILFTSRLQQLSTFRTSLQYLNSTVTMRLLNKKESWDLLRDKVFCKGTSCPAQLEKIGEKIAENCDGLPLMILTVARLLSEEETITPEHWNAVAEKKNHQLFIDAYDEISKVLLSSYTYLSPLLRMCFLYIGLFPRHHKIPRSKLIYLWMADRFFELKININSNSDAVDCLEELVSNNVVMVYEKSSNDFFYTIKTCGLHSSLGHLSRQIARKTKFALVFSSLDDCLHDDIDGHHRLSFNNNVLFGIKGVNKSVEDNCALTARSLLCFSPYQQYQVSLCFRLKLLRELDALSIRFYEFPIEVLQLVQLRYLALTSNGMIPPSISQLSSLQSLFVDRHQNIRSCRHQVYLPMEIWSLQDLRHLQVMGSDLPDPCGASLKSLTTLSNVSARSCTEAILKGIPCLKVLKIRIELTPNYDGKPLSCFTHISCLSELEFLKCTVVNPEVVPPVLPFSSFLASHLTSLSLSGLGYSWKEMRKIALLPNLLLLKLRNYAFQGPEWEVEEGGFIKLDTLVIEDTDMVDWRFVSGAFENLRFLTIKCCYKLEKIRGKFAGKYFRKIELIDCNPSCVDEMKRAMPEEAILDVHSSWNDEKPKR